MDSPQPLRRALKTAVVEVVFFFVAFTIAFFSFLFFFADHAPYPGPFANVRLFVGAELLVCLAIDLFGLRFVRHRFQQWQLPDTTQKWLRGLNIAFVVITLAPLLLVVFLGD